MVAQVEVPDGYRVVTLVGIESDGTPQVVQLDGTGRIVAVIQGEIEGITGPVDVAQVDSVREIQGSDGSTLRTVKLDANGQIIMVPRGQSGNYMSVDASGFLTSVMKGEYLGTPTTLAVDSSGNIVAVIKGEYSGVLKTVATDVDGRMIMIPTDPADVWGNAIGVGNAELAVRLGSPVNYDRRGSVVWYDDFDDGLGKWYAAEVGTGADVSTTVLSAISGAYSAKLTGGSNSTMYAQLQRIFYAPVPGKVGLEMSFEMRGTPAIVQLEAAHYDGTNYYQYYVRWVQATSDFEYQDSAGSWQDIDANKPLIAAAHAWHTMKVVFDTVNGKYVRAMLDDEEYSLANITPQSAASAIEPTIRVRIYVYSSAGQNYYALIDNVILTQNEPA